MGGEGLAERIREAIRDSGLTLNRLGKAAGVDRGTLSRFMRKERDLTLDTAGRVCAAIGLGLTRTEDPRADLGAMAEPAREDTR